MDGDSSITVYNIVNFSYTVRLNYISLMTQLDACTWSFDVRIGTALRESHYRYGDCPVTRGYTNPPNPFL